MNDVAPSRHGSVINSPDVFAVFSLPCRKREEILECFAALSLGGPALVSRSMRGLGIEVDVSRVINRLFNMSDEGPRNA